MTHTNDQIPCTTDAMREFNRELEECDELLANYSPIADTVGVPAMVRLLRRLGLVGSASGLQAAAEAVGYTFPANGQG